MKLSSENFGGSIALKLETQTQTISKYPQI